MTEENQTQANENNTNEAQATETKTKAKGFFRRHGKKMAIGFGAGVVGGAVYAGVKRCTGASSGSTGAGDAVGEAVENAFRRFM